VNKEWTPRKISRRSTKPTACFRIATSAARYDRFGKEGLGNMGGGFHDYTVDFGDIFEELFGGFGFSTGAAFAPVAAPRPRLADAGHADLRGGGLWRGKGDRIPARRDLFPCNGSGAEPGTSPVKCSTCNGQGEVRQVRQTFLGQMVQTATCPTCNGRGETISSPCTTCRWVGLERKTVRKKVQIPAGVDRGTQIRLAGEGGPGVYGGPHGNLFLMLEVKPHQVLQAPRERHPFEPRYQCSPGGARRGSEVPTLDGDEKLKIPVRTQPGKVFHMRGKGVPHLRRKDRGNQLVIVNVAIPTKLTRNSANCSRSWRRVWAPRSSRRKKDSWIGSMRRSGDDFNERRTLIGI
jgi:molecular chaperone DnaJ